MLNTKPNTIYKIYRLPCKTNLKHYPSLSYYLGKYKVSVGDDVLTSRHELKFDKNSVVVIKNPFVVFAIPKYCLKKA